MTHGVVFDIKKYAIHDGPGIRTVVFFKGCPLRCSWCHNPESQAAGRERIFREQRCIRCWACVEACEQGAIALKAEGVFTDSDRCILCGKCVEVCFADARQIVGRVMSVEEVLAQVERDIAFYDQSGGGVTVSGGEPLNQPDFLLALLRACKEREIHTALDTCGHAPWRLLDRIRRYVDLFLYDVKVMDPVDHRRLTGVSNRQILANLRSLAEQGHALILRVPLIPGVTDGESNLHRIGALAAGLAGVVRVDLLPYHPSASDKYARLERPYGLREVRPPSDRATAIAVQILRSYKLHVQVGG